jgi:homoserine dehydrogenase
MNKLKIGILGYGVVGRGTVKALLERQELFKAKTGAQIEIVKICDLNIPENRPQELASSVFTTDAQEILADPEIKVVVELIGGTGFAAGFIEKALKNKKSVVTANKHLLAEKGPELFTLAEENDVYLLAEAAVCGAIPILRSLRNNLYFQDITKVKGIFNGTANFILSKLQYVGGSFEEVLKLAQEKGYAEADPTFDIEGIDAAHKTALLAAYTFGAKINYSKVSVLGISNLIPADFEFAQSLGLKIKLVSRVEKKDNQVYLSTRPELVKRFSALGQTDGVLNSVILEDVEAGPIILSGNGAGGLATGTAVASDLAEIALGQAKTQAPKNLPFNQSQNLEYGDARELEQSSLLRVVVQDSVGILAKITAILSNLQISIKGVHHNEPDHNGEVPILLLLEKAQLTSVEEAAKQIAQYDFVIPSPVILPIDYGK